MSNSISFNAPQINKESPLKLPLAPIVSAPLERRGDAAASSRRGSAIFSPTQALDQPPQLLFPHNYSTTDPDPPTMRPAGASNLGASAPRRPGAAPGAASTSNTKYRECLKNHAASMGHHVVDGCGEFMPSGEEGTFESMRCAACTCHRSFHRRVDAESDPHHPQTSHGRRNPPAMETHHHHHQPNFPPAPRTHPIMMNFGGNSGGATAESSSEDFNMFQSSPGGHAISGGPKKRFRTKFSQEQKDRMHEFADKLGWRIQRQDDEQVQHFCSEVGVKRQVFKVWMHNNKQAMKKRPQI